MPRVVKHAKCQLPCVIQAHPFRSLPRCVAAIGEDGGFVAGELTDAWWLAVISSSFKDLCVFEGFPVPVFQASTVFHVLSV